ncbi:MAG: right-handed parallel beta-helix repeat-containing protein [bacterium]
MVWKCCGFLVLCWLSLVAAASGAEYHVAPTGSPEGNGSKYLPWDLQTALNQPPSVQPGDTITLRQGIYQNPDQAVYTCALYGGATAPIIVRGHPGERATICPGLRVDEGEFVWFMAFEVFNPDTTQYAPYNHARVRTVDLNGGSNLKFINLVIHGGGQGIGCWEGCTDCKIYGCLIYHNGWSGSNQGHGIYVHSDEGSKRIRNNLIFDQLGTGYNLHAFGTSGDQLRNIQVEENVIFDGWSLMGAPATRR